MTMNPHRPLQPLQRDSALAVWLAVGLLLFAAFFRVASVSLIPGLPNFSPVMAIAFCGAFLLPGWMAVVVPLAALAASDIFLNLHYGAAALGWGELVRYVCYAGAVGFGLILRGRKVGVLGLGGAVVANALVFYFVTNSASWFGNPLYSQSLAGWVQALTVGLPGYAPTWTFFRNSLVSDLVFAAAIFGAIAFQNLARQRAVPGPNPVS